MGPRDDGEEESGQEVSEEGKPRVVGLLAVQLGGRMPEHVEVLARIEDEGASLSEAVRIAAVGPIGERT